VSINFLEDGVTLNFFWAGDAGCFQCIAPSDFHLFGPLKHHLSAANIFPTMKL
jgi:hypothetical protein